MVGSGIFMLPGSLAAYGGISLFGWIISAVGALALARVFSDLSSRPSSLGTAGGPYVYARYGLGEFMGFWVAWGYWICLWSGVAAIAIAFTASLSVFFPILKDDTLMASLVTSAAILSLTGVNLWGLKKAGALQLLTTLLKLLPLLAFCLLGPWAIEGSHFEPFNRMGDGAGSGSFSAITASVTLTLWAFLGMESPTVVAHEVDKPAVTIPRATMVGTLLVAALYIVSCVSVMGIVPPEVLQQSPAPYADAARILWGDWAAYLVAGGVCVSCFGALNGWILLQGQIPLAASADGVFPRFFAKKSREGLPVAGMLISSLLAAALIMANFHISLVRQFEVVILLSTLTNLIPYFFSSVVHLKWALSEGSGLGAKRSKAFAVSTVALLFSFYAVVGAGESTVYFGFLLLLAGVPVFVWMGRESKGVRRQAGD